MRHHNTNRKFGRTANQRRALLRSLAVSLVKHESIVTTEAKAKELRSYVEKLITKAGKDNVASRRLIARRLGENQDSVVKKLVDDLAKRYKDRDGGYTRVVKMAPRGGDASPMAIIQFV